MKKILMLMAIILFVVSGAEAQVIVKLRPVAPVVVKPACPSPHHVWVGGSWKWNRKTRNYIWMDGYWVQPRKHSSRLVNGHCRTMRRGWKYIPGHWS
jgi:hypothetical protein